MILTRSNHVAAAAALRRTAQTQRDTHNTKEGREARTHTHTQLSYYQREEDLLMEDGTSAMLQSGSTHH